MSGTGRYILRRLLPFTLTLGAALLLSACSSNSDEDTPPAPGGSPGNYEPGPGSFSVTVVDVTWFDDARGREVPVRIYAPSLEEGYGPFPIIVFSPGGGESRDSFTYLGTYWGQHGYIAIFVTHKGHDREAYVEAMKTGDWSAVTDPANFHQRPEDMSFVIDCLLSPDLSASILKGRIDDGRICVAGQCAGSTTALALVGLTVNLPDDWFIDGRVRVAVALSPQPPAGHLKENYTNHSWDGIYTPTMMVTGTRDFSWISEVKSDPSLLREPYDHMPPGGKYLVDIEEAEHHAFTDSEPLPLYPHGERDPRHHGWIAQTTTGFMDGYLKGNKAAIAWLENRRLESSTGGFCSQEHKEIEDLYKAVNGPFSVETVETVVLHDLVRDKDLQLRVYYPQEKGNFPLLLFSHALKDCKDDYVPLVSYWVSHGYVCILPDHVGSSNLPSNGNDGMEQWRSRPLDMSFLIDSLPDIESQVPSLAGRMDAKRIGACGTYIGASTSNYLIGTRYLGTSGTEAFEDPRVDLSVALSPQGTGQGLTEQSWLQITKPMLVVTGSRDPSIRTGNPPEWRTEPFQFSLPPDKYLVWIEELSAEYGGLGADSGTVATDIAIYVTSSTIAFLDAHLKNDMLAWIYLNSAMPGLYSDEQIQVTAK